MKALIGYTDPFSNLLQVIVTVDDKGMTKVHFELLVRQIVYELGIMTHKEINVLMEES